MPAASVAAGPLADRAPVPPGAATLTVYRPKQWRAGGTFVVELDGIPTVELASPNFVELPVPPGAHVVSLHDAHPERITVDAKPGQTFFMKAWLGFGIINAASHLALQSSDDASKEISCCRAVPLSAWLASPPAMGASEPAEAAGAARGVAVSDAQWIPNAGQEAGWAIYPASLALDDQAIRIDITVSGAGIRTVRIPFSAVATVDYVTHKRICWLTLRRTSGHVEEFRADDCSALARFGERIPGK
jgi:hypothetical protein